MLKRLNVEVNDLDGKAVLDPDSGKPATLKSATTSALLFQGQDDSKMTGDQKLARFALAKKVHDASDTVDLTAEEIVLIKECVNKIFTPLVYGRLVEALDPKEA